jgi:D-alanine transaminase
MRGVGLDADVLLADCDAAVEGLRNVNAHGWTALLYLQATGGSGPRDHLPQRPPRPSLYGTLRHLPHGRVDGIPGNGVGLITVRDFRWQRATWKTTQLLGAIQAKRLARESGADEAIFVSHEGHLLEACSMNLFVVKEGVALTPPLSLNLLPGVTRDVLLHEVGARATEACLRVEDLRTADEIFLSSTTRAVLSVTAVDGEPVGSGTVGPVTRKLAELMLQRQTRLLGAECED